MKEEHAPYTRDEWIEAATQAMLKHYPPGWAFDATNPALIIDNIVRFTRIRLLDEYTCTCDKGYKERGLTDPHCFHCDLERTVNTLMWAELP